MDWAGIKILCIILVAGSRILVSGNTDVEEDKDNESNLEDTLDEADNAHNLADTLDEADNANNLGDTLDEADNANNLGDTLDEADNANNLADTLDEADNEKNLEDTLDEADNEKTPIQYNLIKDVPNETEDEKIDIKDDLNDNGEHIYDEDGNILVEVEDYSYENEEDHSDGELIYDEDGKILVEVEDYSYENEEDHSANIKDDNTVADTLNENEYSVGDLIYDEDGNILEEDEYNSYEHKDEHPDKTGVDVLDTTGVDVLDKTGVYILDKAEYADVDVIYDEDGNIKDDDEFYSYEEDDDFLDVSEVENIGSVLTRAGKSLKETSVGEVVHDDGNVLDDEDDYSYETEDDFTEICPDDYVGIESECFQMSSKSLDWDKASATCEENSGHLASLKHPMALREYIIKHYPKASFWVGGRHIRNPDGWQWISGNRFSPHFPWATHNRVPKKNKGECIILRYFPKQGEPEYVDNKCTRKTRFICERQKVKLDLEKKSITGEHTEQILDTVVSSEEKTDHEKKPDIGTPTPQILEKPTSDDLKLMLSG